MVRFIIVKYKVWNIPNLDLHSNMVRFIITMRGGYFGYKSLFTFQYGQIYYLEFYKFKSLELRNLHSNMVRFIIGVGKKEGLFNQAFTFQYGQIYYVNDIETLYKIEYIYIPIWLDLL